MMRQGIGQYVHPYEQGDRSKIPGQVITSTGKHTNAVLSCLEWMKKNVPDFVEER